MVIWLVPRTISFSFLYFYGWNLRINLSHFKLIVKLTQIWILYLELVHADTHTKYLLFSFQTVLSLSWHFVSDLCGSQLRWMDLINILSFYHFEKFEIDRKSKSWKFLGTFCEDFFEESSVNFLLVWFLGTFPPCWCPLITANK